MRSDSSHTPGSSGRRSRAIDVMRSPVDTVSAQVRVSTAQKRMRQLHVGCLPVLDGNRVVGVVTRWDVDKAMEHRLGSQPVASFMSTPAITVQPGTSFSRMRQLMVDNGIGYLPVMGTKGLLGMVSRSDLLRAWPAGRDGQPKEKSSVIRADNLADLMRERFAPGIRRVLRQIGRLGERLGVNVFLVGGSVRDLLLNAPDVDLDIVVTGDGIVFARKFVAKYGGRVVCYRRFATALMALPDGLKIDVVSARSERYKGPGILPSIEAGALLHDLYRRDFTINSMAIQLSGRHYGRLVDPYGGRRDLRRKTVKVMHNLSFVEDPTRMIRAVRFEGRYGFRMDQRTLHLLTNAARAHMLDIISGQRLREEILMLLREKRPLPAIRRLDRLEILRSLSPKLKVTAELSHLLERIYRRLQQLKKPPLEIFLDSWIVYLMGLFSALTFQEAERLAIRLSLHRKARQCLQQARRAERELLGPLRSPSRPPHSELYRWLHPLLPEVLIYLMARSRSRAVSSRILHFLTHLGDVELEIGGEDLKRLGLAQGVVYKRILDQVLMAKLDGRLKNRSQELSLAAKLAQDKG
jgi:tRNA nucleotidyltransferase (CCA-adding enzyme)